MNNGKNLFDGLTNEELIFMIKYGDKDPFEVLMRRYAPLVGKVVQKYFLRGFDRDDLWQESRLVLYHTIYSYKEAEGHTFGKFYQRTLTNHFTSLVRKETAQKRHAGNLAVSYEGLAEKGVNFHEEGKGYNELNPLEQVLLKDKLEKYSNSLSPLERQVFGAHMMNHSIEEIAESMDAKVSKIKNALDRCKRKLREQMHETDE